MRLPPRRGSATCSRRWSMRAWRTIFSQDLVASPVLELRLLTRLSRGPSSPPVPRSGSGHIMVKASDESVPEGLPLLKGLVHGCSYKPGYFFDLSPSDSNGR